jgi:hypothetical protein
MIPKWALWGAFETGLVIGCAQQGVGRDVLENT